MKRSFAKLKTNKRGQSFVELMLVALILALLLAGVVEFGFLLNNYLHVLDGGREAARFSANADPFDALGGNDQRFYVNTVIRALQAMSPVELAGNNGDDIVISVFSVAGTSIVRFPNSNGWSLCANYGVFDSSHLTAADWVSCTVHASSMSTDEVGALLASSAPPSGILVVEIYYNYPQVLKLPLFADFLDPIPVYTYSVMPLSAAEPTPTPRP